MFFYGEKLLAPAQNPNPCRLSATLYLIIYSQLPSTFGDRLLHPQAEDATRRGVSFCEHGKEHSTFINCGSSSPAE